MTITNQDELEGLIDIGRIVANTMHAMAKAMEPCITPKELDQIGRALMEHQGPPPRRKPTMIFRGPPASVSTSKSRMASPATG